MKKKEIAVSDEIDTANSAVNKNQVEKEKPFYERVISSTDDLSIDERGQIVTFCFETLNVFNKEEFIAQQLENFEQPTQEQKESWGEIYSRCKKYKPIVAELLSEKNINPYYDPDTGIPYPYIELHEIAKEQGQASAIEEAEGKLFSKEGAVRDSAYRFLLEDEDWIDEIVSLAGIDEKALETKQSNIAAAIELRKCELNIEDCSADSLGVLRACGYNPEFCGLSLYDSYIRFMTPFEVERIEKLLVILRGL